MTAADAQSPATVMDVVTVSGVEVTAKDVARSIGWLDAFSQSIEYSACDWSQVEETGEVRLEGRMDGHLIDVTVHITEVFVRPDDSDDWMEDDDDDDE